MRASTGRTRCYRAAAKRDELAPFQLVEWHSVPRHSGTVCRISHWPGSVRRWRNDFPTCQRLAHTAWRFSEAIHGRGARRSPPVKPSHVAGINDVVCTWPPMTSEFPARLIAGYRDFLAGGMATERERYRELARRGQYPAVMIIGCCDSRVSPEVIFDTHPGELFVVRNIANLVPAYTPDGVCHGVFAALEFAVTVLKVRPR